MIHLPDHFRFAEPIWFWGFPAAVVLGTAAYLLSRSRHSTMALGNPGLVTFSPRFFSPDLIPWFLRLSAVALCLLAAARPQMGQKKVEEKMPVTDLFVDLDISGSMITNDLKPDRIQAAKKFLADFLDQVQGVRVGLTIFARFSFTQCPLTTDVQVVKRLLANVEPAPGGSIKWDGTAIGDSLVACLNRLKNGAPSKGEEGAKSSLLSNLFKADEEGKEGETAPNRAVVLLTDGSNNCGMVDPIAAAKVAATQGIRIYAVGMGTQKSLPVMGVDPADGKLKYALDARTGQILMSDPADMNLLRQIASLTGGKAYAATDNQTFQKVLAEIARLEKREVSVTTHWDYNELAPWFLLAAFVFLILDILLETTVLRTLP